jgi:hypothetical protein
MESLISSYGLDFPAFRDLLSTTNSLVAGSAALYAYFQEHGVDPGFVPGDLDIWIEDTRDLIALHGAYEQRGNLYRFSNFLLQQGYNVSSKFQTKHGGDYDQVQHITQIFSFINRQQKEIQLIMITQKNIRDYIEKYFDLSPCVTWWNALENRMKTLSTETLQHKMYVMPQLEVGPRELARIQKYEARGFKLQEKPCPAALEADTRVNMNMLAGQKAFDVIAYEEVDAYEFLNESSYHILLQVCDQLQAFHRTTLYDYMKERTTAVPGMGLVVDTPHRQSLPSEILNIMPYSDYSIYELVPFFTENGKSIYTVQCYTIDQWLHSSPGAIIDISLSMAEIDDELDEENDSFLDQLENDLQEIRELGSMT